MQCLLSFARWLSLICRPALRLLLSGIAVAGASAFLIGCGGSFSIVQTSSSLSPTITSVSQVSTANGAANLKLDIHGTNFTADSSTNWGATPLDTNYLSATQLRVAVPTPLVSTPSTASLTVSTSAGTAKALVSTTGGISPEVFIVSSPTISSLSPSAATAGGSAFTLTINGASFTSDSTVSWCGTVLTGTYVSATQLTATVPASLIATAGSASVTVTNASGTSSAATFTINSAPPTISSLSPSAATAGGSAFTLTINGASFTSDSTVSWCGTVLTATYVSATQLTATVPASLIATAGSASVTVTNASGTSSAATFTINSLLPTITSLSSTSILQGSAAFTLTVNGSNFLSGSLATVVKWNSTALTTTYVSSTKVTAAVPVSLLATAGTDRIAVVTANGTSSAVTFTVNPAQPVISSFTPGQVYAGNSDFTIYVYGSNFTSTATINWNSTPLVTSSVAGSILQATVPASLVTTIGTASITVTTAGGTSASVVFTIKQPLPAITSLSPSVASAGGAKFTLTVNGANFTSKSQVRWQLTWLGVTYVSDTQLLATVPASLLASAGTADIIVYTSGIGGSSSSFFIINPSLPTITSLSPASVTAGGAGYMMTVNGTAFTAASAVTWGTTSLGTTHVGPTQLIAAVPASLIVDSGTASIAVTTEVGTSASVTLPIKAAPPSISGLRPSLVMEGGAAFTLTVSGGYFTSDAIVKWGSTALETTYVDSKKLTASVPAALISAAGTATITVSAAAGTSASAALTIDPGIEITTTALPSGTAGNPYSGPITVTGGVPGYNWKVSGLPDLFTYFNTNGNILTITGTPTEASTINIQVSAEDTSGNTAGPVSYTINVGAGPDGSGNARLNGRYVCLLHGFTDDNGSRWASLYSFQADGQGNFASGVLNTNSHDIGSASGIVSGSYSIGADKMGVAFIHTYLNDGAAGIQTTQWAVALDGNAQPAQQFRMVEEDDLGTLPSGLQGTGNCYLATPSAFAASSILGKSFAFGLEGEDNSGNPKASAGLFSASEGNLASGEIDAALGGSAAVQTTPFTGSYKEPDAATGRFTVALSGAGRAAGLTVYMIDANRMFVLDNTSNSGEQAGNMRLQRQASFSGANLAGPSVLYTRGAEFNSGSTPSGFYASLVEQTGGGDGSLTANLSYKNDNGSYSANGGKGETSILFFDSVYPGRATFDTTTGTAVYYLFDDNSAFVMDVNVDGSLDSGWLEPQTQAAANSSTLAVEGLYGELPQLDVNSNSKVGEFNLAASGAITGAFSTAGQDISTWDRSFSANYSADATVSAVGAFLIAKDAENTASCAVLNAARLVCLSQTDSAPTIEVIEKN